MAQMSKYTEKEIEKISSALLSEKSLAKNWLKLTEDKAWKNLQNYKIRIQLKMVDFMARFSEYVQTVLNFF